MKHLAWRTFPALALLILCGLLNFRESVADPAPTAAVSVNRADIRNWLADRERGLWIQAANSRWFYARFADVCTGLQSTNSLLLDTGASGRIDRTSSVIPSGHRRCRVQSLVPSSGPPKNRNAGLPLQPQTQ